MKIKPEELSTLVRKILNIKEEDIGCSACLEELDLYVELHLSGKNAAETLPLVKNHLDQCRDCREEFEILLQILENYPPKQNS